MFAKTEVNGDNAHPLFKALKKEAPGLLGTEAIKWNFTKFLVDKDHNVVRRYAPTDKPEVARPRHRGGALIRIGVDAMAETCNPLLGYITI